VLKIGDVAKTCDYKGVLIEKVVGRVAYARSGNAHNPTTEYYYIAKRNGKILSRASKLSEIKADIDAAV
jgi:hypothetical protein